MAWYEILAVCVAVVGILVLLKASHDIGRNPYLRVRTHEDFGMKFDSATSFAEKQRRLDLYGIYPRGVARPLAYILIVAAVALLLWFGGWRINIVGFSN